MKSKIKRTSGPGRKILSPLGWFAVCISLEAPSCSAGMGTAIDTAQAAAASSRPVVQLALPDGHWPGASPREVVRAVESAGTGTCSVVLKASDGGIRCKAEMCKGLLSGVVREFYPSGLPVRLSTFRAGQLEGPAVVWYEDGAVYSVGYYAANHPSGRRLFFWPSGQVYLDGGFAAGTGDMTSDGTKRHGTWRWLYENGNTRSIEEYRFGRLEQRLLYHASGRLIQYESWKGDASNASASACFDLRGKNLAEAADIDSTRLRAELARVYGWVQLSSVFGGDKPIRRDRGSPRFSQDRALSEGVSVETAPVKRLVWRSRRSFSVWRSASSNSPVPFVTSLGGLAEWVDQIPRALEVCEIMLPARTGVKRERDVLWGLTTSEYDDLAFREIWDCPEPSPEILLCRINCEVEGKREILFFRFICPGYLLVSTADVLTDQFF